MAEIRRYPILRHLRADAVDFAGLKIDMTLAAEIVRLHYRAIIEAPAAQARLRLSRTPTEETTA